MNYLEFTAEHAPLWIERATLFFLVLIAIFAVFESEHYLRVGLRLFRRQWRSHQFRKLFATIIFIVAALGPGGYYTGELLRQTILS